MKNTLSALAVLATFAAFSLPAHAMGPAKACDTDTVAMVMKQVEEAPADKKTMAMEQFAMAKEKMAAGMNDECSGFLTKASELSAK